MDDYSEDAAECLRWWQEQGQYEELEKIENERKQLCKAGVGGCQQAHREEKQSVVYKRYYHVFKQG